MVVKMETAQAETVGEAAKFIHAGGLYEKALGLIPDPPEAWDIDRHFGRRKNTNARRYRKRQWRHKVKGSGGVQYALESGP